MVKRLERTVLLSEYEWNELTSEDQGLIQMAKTAGKNAHAPYSNFMVGAALLLDNGETLHANNQENVSFPGGVCAERVLLTYAHANYPNVAPLKLAITAKRREGERYASVTPCGICRQTISEMEMIFKQSIEILILTPEGKVLKAEGIDQLLPFKFSDLNG
ncbi:cytidine deaminase [Pararhodonellum marinum]|uniref:cytidine deaminase n=1 Tax=Pararhodonellum marinum TaxID=2755358 RepID=UPI001890AD5A|nr:cytidine deaminase [Pararhodonellum marinum]